MLFRSNGRQAAESYDDGKKLGVTALGNPTDKDEVVIEVRGASGKAVNVDVVNSQGMVIGHQSIDDAGTVERRTVKVGSQTGVYFIKATTE